MNTPQKAVPPNWRTAPSPDGSSSLAVEGDWTLRVLKPSLLSLPQTSRSSSPAMRLRGEQLTSLDTAGASVIMSSLKNGGYPVSKLTLEGFSPPHVEILELVQQRFVAGDTEVAPPPKPSRIIRIADGIIAQAKAVASQVTFLGEALSFLGSLFRTPSLFRVTDFVIQLERAAVLAIPIVCLVNFLIGLVIAYLFAAQAIKFGATIFVVDAVSIGMCRELAPVLTAIIIAGRSGSAFAAQIGAMKIAQEIDAIKVMGLSPFGVLVAPRICALFLALPLLTFLGDLFGTLGGFVVADSILGIPSAAFLNRLEGVLKPRHLYIGLGKAPIFAIVISLLSCRLGMMVEDNARSVGINTTASVVQSVVAVILLDAAFAIAFQQLGW